MIIPPNSFGLPSVHAVAAPPESPAPSRAVMDALRNLILIESLSQQLHAEPFCIDKALDSFWTGRFDDCIHREGAELASHNHQRDLAHLERQGSTLRQEIDAMPAGPARTDAKQKLGDFLVQERARIEAQHQLDSSPRTWSMVGLRAGWAGAPLKAQAPADPDLP